MENFNFVGLVVRFLLSLLLVFITFNPTGYSFVHWFANGFPAVTPLKVVAGIALLIAWLIFVRSTFQAIGTLGVVLMAVFFAALIWLFVSWGWLSLANKGAMTWVVLVIVALVLTAGLSWAHIRKRLSGQATVDEVQER
jgi:hypothetical protein